MVGNQRSEAVQKCSGYNSVMTNLNPEDESSTVSEMLVSNHVTTLRNNPENHNLLSRQVLMD
jgi:hypothetical protein